MRMVTHSAALADRYPARRPATPPIGKVPAAMARKVTGNSTVHRYAGSNPAVDPSGPLPGNPVGAGTSYFPDLRGRDLATDPRQHGTPGSRGFGGAPAQDHDPARA
jgi:hypothetical protein